MFYILVNPASGSGRGKKYWEQLEPLLKEENISYEVYFSEYPGHLFSQIREITQKEFSPHLIILGGDGTFNEALQCIEHFDRVTLSYIPTGSSNDLARDIGLKKDPVENMKHLLNEPQERKMDIGSVYYENTQSAESVAEKRYFAVSCGIGFDAKVCKDVAVSKAKQTFNKFGLGKLVYLAIALKTLFQSTPVSGKIMIPEVEKDIPITNLLFNVAMNHRYEGGGFKFTPDAKDNDGFLDLCLVSNVSRLKVLAVLPTAFSGNHVGVKGVDIYKTAAFSMKTEIPLCIHTDGEALADANFISVECKANQIKFVY